MDPETGGLSSAERQRQTAAAIARKKVLAAYSSHATPAYRSSHPTASRPTTPHAPTSRPTAPHASATQSTTPHTPTSQPAPEQAPVLKDAPIDSAHVSTEWQKYHSAWQNYYQNYYNNYYSKAAENYLATAKMKDERIATGQARKRRAFRRLLPVFIVGFLVLLALFLQYNRLIFAPIMAYIVPDTGSVTTSLEAVDPTINQTVSPDPRLIIPKLNVDVPVAFGIGIDEVMSAMNYGVAQYSIPYPAKSATSSSPATPPATSTAATPISSFSPAWNAWKLVTSSTSTTNPPATPTKSPSKKSSNPPTLQLSFITPTNRC